MRAKGLTLLFIGAALSVACQNNQPDQNITITNDIPANADIEALPPDESSETPANDLAAGVDNADVTDLNVANNSY